MATTFQLRLVGSSIATASTNVEMGCIWSATVLGGVPFALGALFQTVFWAAWCAVSCAGCPGLIILLAAGLVGGHDAADRTYL
jgi:hypothetical protein